MANDIYRPQVAPVRGTDTLPFATRDTFGGEVADAMGRAGQTLGSIAIRERTLEVERNRDLQASAATLKLAEIQQQAATFALDAQEQAGPGGAGYTKAMGDWLGEQQKSLLGSISDEKVRRRVSERMADWQSDTMSRAEAWERGQTVKMAVENHQQTTNIRANRAARLDEAGFAGELTAAREDVSMLEHVPANVKAALERDAVTEISTAWIGSRPPEERKALLASGLFDQLDPSVVKRLGDEADVDLRRAKIEEAAAVRVAKADAKDAVKGVLADLGDGVPVPDEDIATAYATAKQYGLDDEMRKLERGQVENTANREFISAGPIEIDREIKRLDTVIAKAGDKAKREDVWRRDHLIELRGKRTDQVDNDPAEFASRNGIEWGNLDVTDPASISARIVAVRQTQELTGRPAQPLLESEAEQIRANMDSPAGQRAAVELARSFGGKMGAAAMRQLAPNDSLLLHVTSLSSYVAGTALQGRAAVKAKTYVPPKGLDDAMRAYIGQALNGADVSLRGGVLETARSIYAFYADRDGLSSEDVGEPLVKVAVDQALGQTSRDKGGIAHWHDKPFVLPPDMSASTFGKRIANIRTVKGMYWSDRETPITPAQLRDRFAPVKHAGTRYYWVDDRGNYALTKDGRRAWLDIAAIADPAAEPEAGAMPDPRKARSAYEALPQRRTGARPISPYERPGK